MKCPHCKSEIKDTAKFCRFCGNSIRTAAPVTDDSATQLIAKSPAPADGETQLLGRAPVTDDSVTQLIAKSPAPANGETQLLGRSKAPADGETQLLGRSKAPADGETQLLGGAPYESRQRSRSVNRPKISTPPVPPQSSTPRDSSAPPVPPRSIYSQDANMPPVPPQSFASQNIPAPYAPNPDSSRETVAPQTVKSDDTDYVKEASSGKKTRTGLLIGIISVLLLAAIAAGVYFIFFSDVSDAELKEAAAAYLPPAKAASIDMTKNDPSNDTIKFEFDDRRRVSACKYKVDNREYSQKYTYDDDARVVTIETEYKNHVVHTDEIDYKSITAADTFVVAENYYLRMDEDSLKAKTADVTEAPAPTEEATEAPAPTEAPEPAPAPTAASTSAPYVGLKTELADYIGSNINTFAEKVITNMERSESTDGSVGFKTAAVTVSTLPQRQEVAMIAVTAPSDYSIRGITPGMTLEEAQAANPGTDFETSPTDPAIRTFYFNGCDVSFTLEDNIVTYVSITVK